MENEDDIDELADQDIEELWYYSSPLNGIQCT